jgi:polynucleotide 5'-hydroxyl-kinase GRC3/NOL9
MDPQSVSKFTASDKNYRVIKQEEDTYLVVGLKSGEDIVFMGQVLAAPLYGSISVCGAVISSGREIPTVVPEEGLLVPLYPVFSPRTHSLLRIASEPLDMPSIQSHYNPIELDENLVDAILDELKDGLDEFETILVLKELESGLQDMREAVSPFTKNLVRFTKAESSSSSNEHLAIHRLAGFHPIMEEPTPGVKSFKVEHSWQSRTDLALNSSTARQSPIVSVVCGAKDMGKSSFSRYLINRLLAKYKRVAYLETDVGQSEFTPSGLLSLHYLTNPILGPPFTHQQLEPERSFYFGSASPRNNPDYYIACIFELVNHWRQDQDQVRDEQEQEWIPLVVNTQGWVSGVGYELLLNQIRKVGPTDIFTMRHHVFEYKNLPHTFNVDILPVQNEAFMIEKEAPNLHYLDCVLQDPNVMTMTDNFTSIQQRDMTLGSYFHQSGMGDDNYLSPVWNYHQHLIHRTPWVVDWRQTAIWVVYEEVKLNELFYALNGSLVGLVGDVTNYKKQDGPKKSLAENNDTFVSNANIINLKNNGI